MKPSSDFFNAFRMPDSELINVEFNDLPTPKRTPALHTQVFVEMEEFTRQRVRATVSFRAWTEPRGLIDFRSSWNVRTKARGELPTRQEFEEYTREFVYPCVTRNSLLLAFLSSEMASDGSSLVVSPEYWLADIADVSWEALGD